MPDFERPLRSLQIDNAQTDEEKEVVVAYHAGLDRARKEVAFIAAFIAVLAVLAHIG